MCEGDGAPPAAAAVEECVEECVEEQRRRSELTARDCARTHGLAADPDICSRRGYVGARTTASILADLGRFSCSSPSNRLNCERRTPTATAATTAAADLGKLSC